MQIAAKRKNIHSISTSTILIEPRTLSNIYDGAFCENSLRYFGNFRKKSQV